MPHAGMKHVVPALVMSALFGAGALALRTALRGGKKSGSRLTAPGCAWFPGWTRLDAEET
jgi:hypothetical protein